MKILYSILLSILLSSCVALTLVQPLYGGSHYSQKWRENYQLFYEGQVITLQKLEYTWFQWHLD